MVGFNNDHLKKTFTSAKLCLELPEIGVLGEISLRFEKKGLEFFEFLLVLFGLSFYKNKPESYILPLFNKVDVYSMCPPLSNCQTVYLSLFKFVR